MFPAPEKSSGGVPFVQSVGLGSREAWLTWRSLKHREVGRKTRNIQPRYTSRERAQMTSSSPPSALTRGLTMILSLFFAVQLHGQPAQSPKNYNNSSSAADILLSIDDLRKATDLHRQQLAVLAPSSTAFLQERRLLIGTLSLSRPSYASRGVHRR